MSFDRVAQVYDATRGLPTEVAEMVADGIVAATAAVPDTRFLELGVGTGRVALPLVQRGYPFTGIDISREMMARFADKAGDAPNLTLVEGDIASLPFPNDCQDVVLVIHVFHLVQEWQTALEETRRVLAPGGHFVWGGNDTSPEHPGAVIRREWVRVVRELGGEMCPRYGDWEAIGEAVGDSGARTASYQVASWRSSVRPSTLLSELHDRTYSAGWTVQQEILDEAHERLLRWAQERYGDIDEPVEGDASFVIFVSRWD